MPLGGAGQAGCEVKETIIPGGRPRAAGSRIPPEAAPQPAMAGPGAPGSGESRCLVSLSIGPFWEGDRDEHRSRIRGWVGAGEAEAARRDAEDVAAVQPVALGRSAHASFPADDVGDDVDCAGHGSVPCGRCGLDQPPGHLGAAPRAVLALAAQPRVKVWTAGHVLSLA
jgi:hypothetical protein